MNMISTLLFIFVASLILVFFSILFYKLWLNPIHLQNKLRSQGLKGPSYKFIHGNAKEILKMRKQAISSPCELSQHDIFPRILPHLHTWMNLYGNNFVVWIGHQPQIVVTDPELVKEVLTNKEGVYHKTKPAGHLKKLLGDGHVVAEGEKWSRLRKIANHAFHGENLKDMVPAMVASVDAMMEKWRNYVGKEIEVSNEFKLLTSEVISRTAFGSSYLEGKNIFEMLEKLGGLIVRNAFRTTFFGLEKIWRSRDDIESDKIVQSLRESIVSLIKKREDKVTTGEADDFGSDFLGSLLKVHHDMDEQNRISVDEIVDECKAFYIAGHETTSSLLSWIVVLLSIYANWQEKAREEVLQLLGQDKKPTAESTARLKIVTMIVNETLRLYSPVVSIPRTAQRSTKLGKFKVPANVDVYIAPLALHRNPEIWGHDAHLFNPERFSEGLAKVANGNTMAFVPFGAGARVCVGFNFAVNEAKITLSMILQRYRLSLSPNYVHSAFKSLTVYPQHGIQIILNSL